MTLPPHRIGDKGLRFEVRCKGWPEDGWRVYGWTDELKRAKAMAKIILNAPTATAVKVLDRNKEQGSTGEAVVFERKKTNAPE